MSRAAGGGRGPRRVDAGRLWTGGPATAVVAALVASRYGRSTDLA